MTELNRYELVRLAGVHASKADDCLLPPSEEHVNQQLSRDEATEALAHATLAIVLIQAANLDTSEMSEFDTGWQDQ